MEAIHNKDKIGESANNKTVVNLGRIDDLLNKYEANKEKPKRKEIGDSWLTVNEIAEMRGTSRTTTGVWLRRCVRAGLVEIGRKRLSRIIGGTYPVLAYRFKRIKNIKEEKK